MKIKPRFFVVTFTMLAVLCSTVGTSWAGGLEERLEQLKEYVGTPEELQKKDPRFSTFIGKVLPNLIVINNEYGIEKKLQPEEKIEDAMAFVYQTTAERLDVPLGFWSEQMWTQMPVMADALCFILRVIRFPKREDYKETIRMVRPTLLNGAYNRLVVRLSLKDPLFEIPTEDLISKPLPSVDAFINLDAVKMLRQREEE